MKLVNATASMLEALVRYGRGLRLAMIALMALVVLLDILKPSHYSRFPWDGVPGFTAVFAFLGALLLIGVYKAIGFGLVYRRPDYYQDDNEGPGDG
ncbi:hypothetical protein [Spiribacter vilamensis]|uniref:Uncharacterized protein n=1 Tax=Spiribacter vilamensis TaxID=531306 RepID=A0A4Q8CYB8_9GAMM|nr:hypothetical protein [Spiribacter vilamensis]RZU97944.1 hypothetical protein EV698_0180 [Spiribacter vilamensis]TVO61143.1 hypothetical protein FPL09_03030 [Spiribacter vilamensis]